MYRPNCSSILAIAYIEPAYRATYDWPRRRVLGNRYSLLIGYPKVRSLIWLWLVKLFGATNPDIRLRKARNPSKNPPIKLFVGLSNLRLKHHRLVRYVVKTQRLRKRVRCPFECRTRCFFTINQHQSQPGPVF